MSTCVVAAMYHFAPIEQHQLSSYQQSLLELFKRLEIKGTLLLAQEGINGTVASNASAIEALIVHIRQWSGFASLQVKYSYHDVNPFYRAKVKLKKEIVTMGKQRIDVPKYTAKHVNADAWDQLLADPECLVIDTRNDYEVEIGTFDNAINPNTETFRQFPEYIEQHLDKNKQTKIAMFCTGGIRCEKASAYMQAQGYENVYQLQGGILQYLEDKQGQDSAWQGDCFVFDNRVAVDKHLKKSIYDQCYACRRPITDEDKKHVAYVEGVSCHRCVNEHTEDDKERFSQRQKQMRLAKIRGVQHIGVDQKDKVTS